MTSYVICIRQVTPVRRCTNQSAARISGDNRRLRATTTTIEFRLLAVVVVVVVVARSWTPFDCRTQSPQRRSRYTAGKLGEIDFWPELDARFARRRRLIESLSEADGI